MNAYFSKYLRNSSEVINSTINNLTSHTNWSVVKCNTPCTDVNYSYYLCTGVPNLQGMRRFYVFPGGPPKSWCETQDWVQKC